MTTTLSLSPFQEVVAVVGLDDTRHLLQCGMNLVSLLQLLKTTSADEICIADGGGSQSEETTAKTARIVATLSKHFRPGVGFDILSRHGEMEVVQGIHANIVVISPTMGKLDINGISFSTTVGSTFLTAYEHFEADEKATPPSGYNVFLITRQGQKLLEKFRTLGFYNIKSGDVLKVVSKKHDKDKARIYCVGF